MLWLPAQPRKKHAYKLHQFSPGITTDRGSRTLAVLGATRSQSLPKLGPCGTSISEKSSCESPSMPWRNTNARTSRNPTTFTRGKWAAEWSEEGRRYRRSSGTNDRDLAKRSLRQFRSDLAEERRPQSPPVSYARDGYQQWLAANGECPPLPWATNGRPWRAVFRQYACREHHGGRLQGLHRQRRAQGRKDATIWNELGHLRSALNWAAGKNIIGKAPVIYRPERPPPRTCG